MDGEFQASRQSICFDRVGDDCEVVVELFFELGGVADVVDALVEATGEFRGDGLDRDALVGDRCEDHQKFRWGLRAVGFIHGDLGDKIRAFCGEDVVVDRLGFLGGFKKLVGGFFNVRA